MTPPPPRPTLFPYTTLFRSTTRQPTTDSSEAPIHYGQRLDRENPANPQNVTIGRSLEELFCDHPNVLAFVNRSEEHTSELQSRLHLVCRLLLEKKKQKH